MRAANDPDLATSREELLIGGFDILSIEDYGRISQIEDEAMKLGYQELNLVRP
jgi:hypothetical protein